MTIVAEAITKPECRAQARRERTIKWMPKQVDTICFWLALPSWAYCWRISPRPRNPVAQPLQCNWTTKQMMWAFEWRSNPILGFSASVFQGYGFDPHSIMHSREKWIKWKPLQMKERMRTKRLRQSLA
jgi:hypothetical protein